MIPLALALLQVQVDWPLPDFRLTERSGRTVTLADLKGQVWICDFIFTHCAGPCPIMTHEMKNLQSILPRPVRFVSFSVDPERDSPQVLKDYADQVGAHPDRWWFLTGEKKTIFDLAIDGFKVTARDPEAGSDQVIHSTRFLLVGPDGRVKSYYNFAPLDDPETSREEIRRLVRDATRWSSVGGVVPVWHLPKINAGLNGACALFLAAGWLFVRRKKIGAHRFCMGTAVALSALFLSSYLVYHGIVGSVRFEGPEPVRTVYLGILLTHTVLAASLPVLVPWTLFRALRGNFEGHRRIARWTLPIWLYVSVTGVVVYAMLYLLYAA